MKKVLYILLVFSVFSVAQGTFAKNTTKTVSQVTDGVELTTAVDYHITSTNPFTTAGSIDIQNEDAVVIFDNIHPSVVRKSYLSKISINGVTAKNDNNAFATIWQNGTIVYPHKNIGFNPLTVYSEKDFQGESGNSYVPYTKYGNLGTFKDNIRSFKLKRGYMVCFATGSTGKGYSRVWVAQDEDQNVSDIGRYLSGKTGFIRIVAWKATSKKGTANCEVGTLNAQTTYNWGGGDDDYGNVDYEYVGMHHHEGWTNWGVLAGNSHEIHVLGNNEPDNSGDSKEQYIPTADIESTLFSNGAWAESQTTGMRIGAPAVSGDISGWLVTFMNLCKKYNQRIDFVPLHLYWHSSGSSYVDRVNWVYSLFQRPVWITEWNYGANWTSETWPDGNRGSGSGNQAHELAGIKDIVNALEANSHLERYLIYNWVEDCRCVILNGALTPAGQWYADKYSNMAYSGGDNYVPTWNYWAPEDLTVEYNKTKKIATLRWTCNNDKQTDSIHIERKITGVDKDYVTVRTLPMTQGPSYVTTDTLKGLAGYISYRITNFDSDGKQRQTGEAGVTLGTSSGNSLLQYGTLQIGTLDAINTDFGQAFDAVPTVFMGIVSSKNAKTYPCNLISSVSTKGFTYQFMPWQKSNEQTVTNTESIPFLAVKAGNYSFPGYGLQVTGDGNSDMLVEIGSAKVKGDTTEVVFNEPFLEGVTPVVIAELKPTLKSNALMYRIWDVTNTGFKATVMYEEALGKNIAVNQPLNYMACTPGQALINGDSDSDDDAILISAGVNSISDQPLYGSVARPEYYILEGDTLLLDEPVLFGDLQTYNVPAGTILRKSGVDRTTKLDDGTSRTIGASVKRCVDGSSAQTGTKKETADQFGWICLSAPDVSTGIERVQGSRVQEFKSENPLHPYVINGVVYLENNEAPFELYNVGGTRVAENATQAPGIYVIKQGKKTAKIIIR